MPHDAKNQELKPGDHVIVPFKVRSVQATEDYCNLELETIATMPPLHRHKSSLAAINTKMVVRANAGDDLGFEVLQAGESFKIVAPATDEPGSAGVSLGCTAYNAYLKVSGGKSFISGAPLPTWEEQDSRISQAWDAAAEAVWNLKNQ